MNYYNTFITKKTDSQCFECHEFVSLNAINKTEPNSIKEHLVVKQSKINLRRNQFRGPLIKKVKWI